MNKPRDKHGARWQWWHRHDRRLRKGAAMRYLKRQMRRAFRRWSKKDLRDVPNS